VVIYHTGQKFGKVRQEVDCLLFFFDNFDFEKYAEFAINFKILFIEHEGKYISGQKYTFKDFMEGKISEIGNRLPNRK
jgi:glutamate--cysteine ligase